VGLTTGELANLFNGVSQQPPALRSTSQHEALVNVWSSLVDGLGKRMPTNHVAKINSLVDAGAFVHIIDRDATEKYAIILRDNTAPLVYDLTTGAVKTVTTPDGVGYLDCVTPRTDFAAITIADHTFIVNKTKVVAMGGATTGGVDKGSKQKFSDLPAVVAGDVYHISGDNTNSFDDYYVKGDASGVWAESTKIGIQYQLDATTMPHKLVRNADGTWTFQKITWADRLVGDDLSNPKPHFVGKTISDLFLHRNRLGVCSDEGVVASRSGDYYNFWARTVTAVLDDDPIDFNVAHTKVSLIRHALPFSGALLLFSDKTQFQMSAGSVLTPKNVVVDPTTEFEASRDCKPVGVGQDAFFAVERGNYTSFREYFVDKQSVTNDADDITAHVPKYVPKGVFKIAASTSEDALVALSTQERNALWVYKYYWKDTQNKLQSAWAKFTFDSGDTILGCEFVGSKLYLVTQRADGMHIEWMNFLPAEADLTLTDGNTITVLLDRKCSLTGAYNAGTGLTTWTLPYADSGTFNVVLGDLWTAAWAKASPSPARTPRTSRRSGTSPRTPRSLGASTRSAGRCPSSSCARRRTKRRCSAGGCSCASCPCCSARRATSRPA
jgi:hypothetical protein